jgi:hypothetical protein
VNYQAVPAEATSALGEAATAGDVAPEPETKTPPPRRTAVHHGITCDASGMSPIIGARFHLRGRDFDLCEAEYRKLDPEAQRAFELVPPPDGPPPPSRAMPPPPPGARSPTFDLDAQSGLSTDSVYMAESYSLSSNSKRSVFSHTNGVPLGATPTAARSRAAELMESRRQADAGDGLVDVKTGLSRAAALLASRQHTGEFAAVNVKEAAANSKLTKPSPEVYKAESYSLASKPQSVSVQHTNGVPLGGGGTARP